MDAARTYLFVPGNRPERYAKALASGADIVVIDLEDAVAAGSKGAARDAVADWAAGADGRLDRVAVRINDARSTTFDDDLRLIRAAGIATVMLPKSETDEDIMAIGRGAPGVRVLALVETAVGVANAASVAAADGIVRLVFGTLDFALDLGLDISTSSDALVHAAGCLTIASRVAGLPSPVAGVTPQVDDERRLLADLAWSRAHGFGAKLCIHPRQVDPIHAAFRPSGEAVEWARRVVAAAEASPGAVMLDGRMIDRPVVIEARRTLQRAGR